MTPDDLESSDYATYLIGEAVRRAMMGEVGDLPPEIRRIAWDVFGKLVPATLTPDEFRVIDMETGLYPPGFQSKYADRFRKAD